MRSVEASLRNAHLVPVLLLVTLQLLRVLGSDGLGKVSVYLGVGEIDAGGAVVAEDPREHVVLVEVIVGPPTILVQQHQVLEIGDASFAPPLRELAVLELLARIFDDLHPLERLLEGLRLSLQPCPRVERDELGCSISEEELEGVVCDLGELAIEYLGDLISANLNSYLLAEQVLGWGPQLQVP